MSEDKDWWEQIKQVLSDYESALIDDAMVSELLEDLEHLFETKQMIALITERVKREIVGMKQC